jgi:hypothetical protein
VEKVKSLFRGANFADTVRRDRDAARGKNRRARASPSLARIRAISAKNTHPRDAHVACMDLTF